jgi:TetR/AcrR family transcriptional regulator, tetracycline repressor protein
MTRRAPGRPFLPLDRIVGTALQIVDEEGAEALNLRALAQRLGSSTATLYRHFTNRAELVSQVVDRMLGEIGLDAAELESVDWQTACRRIATSAFEALRRHDSAASLLVDHVPTGPNAMALRELLLAALLRDGFSADIAARSAATIARFVLGFAMQQRGQGPPTESDLAAGEALRSVDPAQFPATSEVAHLLPIELAEEFAFGLDLLVSGLAQLRASGPPEGPVAKRAPR